MSSYLSVANSNWEELKIQSSLFCSKCFHISNATDIKNALLQAKKTHPKATHWCFGAVYNYPNNTLNASDNGEPNGTAGLPIQRAILSNKLHNSGIVVVRYYGGTKLGTRGLIEAYSQSAILAIQKAEIITFYLSTFVTISTQMLNENELFIIVQKLCANIRSRNLKNTFIELEIQIQADQLNLLNDLKSQFYKVTFHLKN